MQPFSFECPYCQAPLKMRDRSLVGNELPCPDCGETLLVASDDEQVVARKVINSDDAIADEPHERPQLTHPVAKVHPLTDTDSAQGENDMWWKQPHVVAWGVALVFGAGMAVALWPKAPSRDPIEKPVHAAADPQPDLAAPPAEGFWDSPGKDVEQQLTRLGKILRKRLEVDGHFPAGMVDSSDLETKFSWQAGLFASASENRVAPPKWDRGWRDPVNGRFVRRRLSIFLNPALDQLASEEGFPAGHFVGMAGVGADAADLPREHERAGIFGNERKTRPEDIKDGLAHTILLAGVQSRLGAWAAGGPATVRPLVHEPYINGPDGFGTGEKEGMWVLMADGSVVFRSVKTDPAVLRAEAAMADEFYRTRPNPVIAKKEKPPVEAENDPLKELIGEVADLNKQQQEEKAQREAVPVLNREKIEARLNQKIARFQLAPEATFGVVFLELEELVAVPLEYDAEKLRGPSGVWNRPVQFDLEKVTVGEVLEKLLQSVGLTAKIAEGKIVILSEKPAP